MTINLFGYRVRIFTTSRPCQTANRLFKCKIAVNNGKPTNGEIAHPIINIILTAGVIHHSVKVTPVTAHSIRGPRKANVMLKPTDISVTTRVNVRIPKGIAKNRK